MSMMGGARQAELTRRPVSHAACEWEIWRKQQRSSQLQCSEEGVYDRPQRSAREAG